MAFPTREVMDQSNNQSLVYFGYKPKLNQFLAPVSSEARCSIIPPTKGF